MKFKTGIFILLISFAFVSLGIAQSTDDYVRPENQHNSATTNSILSFGFGMGGDYPYTGTNFVENPNLSLYYENCILKNAGPGNVVIGGIASYKSIYSSYSDYYSGYSYEQRWNYYILGTRLSYHIKPFANKSIETYAGGMIAYYITTFKFTSNDPNYADPADPGYFLTANSYPNFFAFSIYAGVRSWFNSHASVWFELGYGYSSLAFGVSYKI